jgi:Kdo2-lipid IVA lauroyltransferase/acyltransferase
MTKAADKNDYSATARPRGLKTRLIKAVRPAIAAMPPWMGHPVAAVVGELVYWVARKSRRAAISNISHVMGPVSRRTLKKTVRHVFHNVMRNYYELCRAPDLTDATVDRMIDFDESGWQNIKELHDSGRGVLLASAHFGSFDMVTQVLARHEVAVTALIARINPPWLSDFISDLRSTRGVELLLVDQDDKGVNLSALKESIKILRNNGVLGVVVDRNQEQKGVKIKFFGYDTIVASGIAKMALRTNSPIVLGIARRLNTYRFSLTFEDPIEPVGSASNEEDVVALMTQIFARVQYHISQNPEQWVLLQPVWPTAAGEEH